MKNCHYHPDRPSVAEVALENVSLSATAWYVPLCASCAQEKAGLDPSDWEEDGHAHQWSNRPQEGAFCKVCGSERGPVAYVPSEAPYRMLTDEDRD